MHFTSWRTALVVAIGVLAVTSCGNGDDAVEVRMLDNLYAPEVIEVDPGETITFVNRGRVPHNVISDDGVFDSLVETGVNQQAGESYQLTIDEPGVYDYFCSLHATQNDEGEWDGMVGTIVVGGVADAVDVAAEANEAAAEWSGSTRSVPDEYPTIQSAVDAADPGDLVLIGPGRYREAVSVNTPGLTLRGTDRNEVILDGEYTRENGVFVTADGVAIENMTAIGYTVNNFFWSGVTGYRGSYLTSIDGWVYGIYAFDSVDGLLEHSYASGSYDAGFYIGQCDPCNAVITDVVSEFNGLGYSGTNSSGNLYIVNSEWRNNVGGIVPNSLDSELLPPVNNVFVGGNYIHHIGEEGRAPSGTVQWSSYGLGVALVGARDSVVRNNLFVNNRSAGVGVGSYFDASFWRSGGNEVRDNVIVGSGRADLMLGGPLEQGSCFSGNDGSISVPFWLTPLHSCDGINLPLLYGLGALSDPIGRVAQAQWDQNPQLDHGDAPMPALTFGQLPGGADAPVRPAVDVFTTVGFDPSTITTPELPAGVEIDGRRPVILGIAVDGGFWPVLFGALLWWIPLLTWLLGAAWALRQLWTSERAASSKVIWSLVVVAIPVFGVLAFVGFAHRTLSRRRRLVTALGGPFVWLVLVVVAMLVGGVV